MRYRALLFVAVTVAVGGVYWARSDEADWWAHVAADETKPSYPKFKLTWPEQMVMSGIIGAVYAAPVTLGLYVARVVRPRTTI